MINKLIFQSSHDDSSRELHVIYDGQTVVFKVSSSTTSAEFTKEESETILDNVKRMIAKGR